jgi:hypothetical protein
MSPSPRTPKPLHIDGLPAIHPNVAGIDIGADELVVAIPPDRDPEPVRTSHVLTNNRLFRISRTLVYGDPL